MKTLILICALFFIPNTVLADYSVYTRVASANEYFDFRLVMKPDSSYEYFSRQVFKWEDNVRVPVLNPKWKLQSSGVWEFDQCWIKSEKSNPNRERGNVLLYNPSGEMCCLSSRKIGAKHLFRYIAGLNRTNACRGGLYNFSKEK